MTKDKNDKVREIGNNIGTLIQNMKNLDEKFSDLEDNTKDSLQNKEEIFNIQNIYQKSLFTVLEST